MAESHDVVLYLHHWKSAGQQVVRPSGVPVMENNNPSFSDTIRHLAGARVVVSNSYHGGLLGAFVGKARVVLAVFKQVSQLSDRPRVW